MSDGLDIAFFGSSILSSWWNGACTYYRGVIRELHELGHHVTFYEPIAYNRQEHRDIPDPPYCDVVIYDAETEAQVRDTVGRAANADVVIKTSGVGVFDELLEEAVLDTGSSASLHIFWDVDAPATLSRVEDDSEDPFRKLLPRYDAVFTYGGGQPVVDRYRALGADECLVVYNALDPTTHHRVDTDARFQVDLALLANRLPDREDRIDEFFFRAAYLLPDHSFLLGGNGWDDKPRPGNVRVLGHVGTEDHNAFNCSPLSVLNVTRESMALNGWSPATRVFEATGVGACLITDAWAGINDFFAPGSEILVAADGVEVANCLAALDEGCATEIGQRAMQRALDQHTYADRAKEVDAYLRARVATR